MRVTITDNEFWTAIKGAKRAPEILQQCSETHQLIVGWKVLKDGAETKLMVKVYTSIFGTPGAARSRGVAQDSIRVALVDMEAGRGLGRTSYTQRTVGWEPRLVEKIKEMAELGATMASAGEKRCPICNATMTLRTATRGRAVGSRFWGCNNFPRCRGTRQFETEPRTSTGNQASLDELAARRQAGSKWS